MTKDSFSVFIKSLTSQQAKEKLSKRHSWSHQAGTVYFSEKEIYWVSHTHNDLQTYVHTEKNMQTLKYKHISIYYELFNITNDV